MTVKSGHGISDMTSTMMLVRTAQAGQPGTIRLTCQPGEVRSAWRGQPGQKRDDGMPGNFRKNRNKGTSVLGTGEQGTRPEKHDS
jgi:hypothetical protein